MRPYPPVLRALSRLMQTDLAYSGGKQPQAGLAAGPRVLMLALWSGLCGVRRWVREKVRVQSCAFGLAVLMGLLLSGVSAGWAAPAVAGESGVLRQWVTDPQAVLSADEAAALSAKLYQLSQTVPGHPQILVSLPGHVDDISLYANEAFHKTGIGRKGVDNGLLVVLDIPDRQSRIEVGYGLEGVLTDLQTNDILQAAKPALQAGNYAQAVNGIVDALADVLKHADPADIGGSAAASQQPDSTTDALEALIGLVVVGLLFVVLPVWLIRRARRRAALYPGGYVPPEVQAERTARWSFFLNLGLNILSAILQSRGGGRGGGGGSGNSGGFSGGGGDSGGGGSQSSW